MDQNDLEALLATLRQAQDAPVEPAAAAVPAPALPPAVAAPPQPGGHVSAPSQSDLESLLTTLRSLPDAAHHSHLSTPDPVAPPPPTTARGRDLTKHSFQESLPIINALAIDPAFLDKVEAIWDEQKNWELRMKDERNRLLLELKRSGLSPVAQSQKLREWDRALQIRWVKLQHEQQEALRALGVPTFHRTTEPTILKRQERIIEVLVGFLEDRDV
ncbi:hypothetical protein JCM10908_006231 [Rhodotorula pacifica]|uniref:uncharacterized protein n=1 Tax=Rhodotorula pacifica TaxID=1495444 RepID=UPI00318119D9